MSMQEERRSSIRDVECVTGVLLADGWHEPVINWLQNAPGIHPDDGVNEAPTEARPLEADTILSDKDPLFHFRVRRPDEPGYARIVVRQSEIRALRIDWVPFKSNGRRVSQETAESMRAAERLAGVFDV